MTGYIEGVGHTPAEEMVRQLRIENNELRMRLDEASSVGGATNGMRTSLMGSFGTTGNLQGTFNQRKDSVISTGPTGYVAL